MNHLHLINYSDSKPVAKKIQSIWPLYPKCLDSFKWSCDLSEEIVLEMNYTFYLLFLA